MKNIKTTILLFFIAILSIACASETEPTPPKAQDYPEAPEVEEDEITTIKIENLLRDTLELREGIEVIMSYVEVPKATTLPSHYHPGEEYAYLLEGSGKLELKDQSVMIIKAGEAGKVPLKHVHSFSTEEEAAKMVVFRVHEKGEPDRILVEDH